MSPASWMRVRGFVELPTYGFFDAMLLHQARRHGIAHALVAYPALVVHENHGDGGFAKRIGVYTETRYMDYLGKPNPNTEDWGHPHMVFAETEWRLGKLHREGVPDTEKLP